MTSAMELFGVLFKILVLNVVLFILTNIFQRFGPKLF
eukprot:SAG31_NODE_349_length_17243_cov_7.408248_1_plen_37_part_00